MNLAPYHNIAKIYDAIRPGYPQELIEDMVVCSGLSADSVILEIGAGTGKATEHLLSLECEVDAVEIEPAMAELKALNKVLTFPRRNDVCSFYQQYGGIHYETDNRR